MYQDKDKNMLFTNKILFKKSYISDAKSATFSAPHVHIMIFDRLPQVSGQYKSSSVRPCRHVCYKDNVIIVQTNYVIATRY